MKTEYELRKDDLSKKEEKIQAFEQALREHCANQYDINNLVYAMEEVSGLISEYNEFIPEIVTKIQKIASIIDKSGDNEALKHFSSISDIFLRTTIVAGRNVEGISIIHQMHDDLYEVSDLR